MDTGAGGGFSVAVRRWWSIPLNNDRQLATRTGFPAAGAICLLALSSLLCAQTAGAEIKIGVVNFRQLLEESPDTRTAMLALEAQYSPRRQELLKMQRDVKNHPNDQELKRKFATEAAEFQDHASASRDDAVRKVSASIVETVGVYARQQGLDLVVADKPLFTGPLSDKTAAVMNVTSQVQALIRTTQPLRRAELPIAANRRE
jgi:Skp family chaperone for outer membrane proteins